MMPGTGCLGRTMCRWVGADHVAHISKHGARRGGGARGEGGVLVQSQLQLSRIDWATVTKTVQLEVVPLGSC